MYTELLVFVIGGLLLPAGSADIYSSNSTIVSTIDFWVDKAQLYADTFAQSVDCDASNTTCFNSTSIEILQSDAFLNLTVDCVQNCTLNAPVNDTQLLTYVLCGISCITNMAIPSSSNATSNQTAQSMNMTNDPSTAETAPLGSSASGLLSRSAPLLAQFVLLYITLKQSSRLQYSHSLYSTCFSQLYDLQAHHFLNVIFNITCEY